MTNKLIICDVETGGTDPNLHPITQITMQVLDPNTFQALHTFESFVKPYNNLTITKEALEHSRVSMKEINAGIDSAALMKAIINVFKIANKSGKDQSNPYFVGHNFGFDFQFLEYLFTYHNKNLYDFAQRVCFDTLAMMKLFEGNSLKASESSKYNLTNCCERMGITLRNAHGSAADVAATEALFIKLVNLQRNANPTTDSTTGNTTKSKSNNAHRSAPFFEF
jgi:DNA polymerase III epsilon subunit-like protein